jgi:hypothetical protein
MQTPSLQPTNKSNWVKQVYFYLVLAVSLFAFSLGLFQTAKANLVKFVFPKADMNSMYYGGPGISPESQCKMGGTMYYTPKFVPTDTSKPYTPPVLTESEMKECIEATTKGMENQKDIVYQSDSLVGILTLVISGIIGVSHLLLRKFFLRKE